MKREQLVKWVALLAGALALSGCEGQVMVLGNICCMGVTCAMLWSTVHLDKRR